MCASSYNRTPGKESWLPKRGSSSPAYGELRRPVEHEVDVLLVRLRRGPAQDQDATVPRHVVVGEALVGRREVELRHGARLAARERGRGRHWDREDPPALYDEELALVVRPTRGRRAL